MSKSNLNRRILFINNTSKLGAGTSQSLFLLVKYLAKSFELSVVSDRESNELPLALTKLNVSHFGLRNRTVIYLPQLIYLILSKRIDLVYGNNLSGRTRVAFWAARITRRPFIWHIRESLIKGDKRGKEVHLADAIIANSEDTAKRLVEYAGVNVPIVIHNGVDMDAFNLDREACRQGIIERLGFAQNSIIVINLGRVCEQKNQLDAVRVGIRVLDTFPQIHFLFLGNIQDQNYINAIYQEINATCYHDHFHFLGHIDNFVSYLMGSDCLLHTAKREPQGRVIVEAMAAQLPVVAYEVGGVGESILDQLTGFLVPFGDIDGLTQSLSFLIRNPGKRKQMGELGYQHVKKHFSAEETANKVNDIITYTFNNYQKK